MWCTLYVLNLSVEEFAFKSYFVFLIVHYHGFLSLQEFIVSKEGDLNLVCTCVLPH